MPAPLRIKSISFKNFMSYGDYETSINLDSLGPTLIIGNNNGDQSKSNGVGKTSLTTAIVWCLFGRTPSKPNPGDRIINNTTKGECYVKIVTVDGWTITRTRNVNGHNDLLIHKDDTDITLSTNNNAQQYLNKLFNLDYDIFMSSVFFGQKSESLLEMSDTKRKSVLERMLGLHRLNIWGDIAKEKKTATEIEQQRIISMAKANSDMLNKLSSQIQSIKNKSNEFERERIHRINALQNDLADIDKKIASHHIPDIESLRNEAEIHRKKIDRLQEMKSKAKDAASAIAHLDNEIKILSSMITRDNKRIQSIGEIDITAIAEAHRVADEAEKKRNALVTKIDEMNLKMRMLQQDLHRLDNIINDWERKSGTQCPSCKQPITGTHVNELCKPYKLERRSIDDSIMSLKAHIHIAEEALKSIVINRPQITLDQATREANELHTLMSSVQEMSDRLIKRQDQLNKLNISNAKLIESIESLEHEISNSDIEVRLKAAEEAIKELDNLQKRRNDVISEISAEKNRINPYNDIYHSLNNELAKMQANDKEYANSINELDNHIKHLEYIRRSYHDRNKIKSWILSDMIPYLNQRIEYYLNALECDVRIRFTNTLSVETPTWGYEFHSGGQQKRIDLSIMFAMYDLHILMYGPQCNVMVLDEIDGSLDAHGVRAFVDVINNDFSGNRQDKPDTVLIISHKNEMVDQFPNHILVTMGSDGFSHISHT
ncbi:MAG: AAA family ATPase [Candidatus Nitrosocaldus sp.]